MQVLVELLLFIKSSQESKKDSQKITEVLEQKSNALTVFHFRRCSTFHKSNSSDSLTPEPEALRITRTVLFSLIAALALVGNYVVCRAVWRFTGAKPIAHYLVSNLAFAEIINMVCIVFMFHAYERPWSWELGSAMCKILPSLQVTSSLVITASLAILAVY